MSASNWSVCPQCTKSYVSPIQAAKIALNKGYGKVSIEQYDILLANLREAEAEQEEEPQTLREDYEQGIEDGEYSVFYKGQCEKCGFLFRYSYKQNVL